MSAFGRSAISRRWLLAAGGLSLLQGGCSPAEVLNSFVPESGYRLRQDQRYGAGPRRRIDIYVPQTANTSVAPAPAVMFFYGGGWRDGEKEAYRFVGQALAARGFVVAIPDYGLYPKVRFPDFLEDCATAVAWFRENAAAHGADPDRFYLAGHSSGAYNAAMLALDERWLAAAGLDARRHVRGTIGLAGPYDFLPLDEYTQPIFGKEEDPRATQPITFVDGVEAPMMLASGLNDRTVTPRNTTSLAMAIQRCGGRVQLRLYPDIGHVQIVAALASPLSFLAPVLDDSLRFMTGD